MNDQTFLQDEAGAVTVDWVVLSAFLVGLAMATIGVVSGGLGAQTEILNRHFSDGAIIRVGFSDDSKRNLVEACKKANCSTFLTGDEMALKSTAGIDTALATASTLDTVAGFNAASYDPNLTQNAAGQWGTFATTGDPNSAFTANAAAQANFDQRVANDAYRTALQQDRDARHN